MKFVIDENRFLNDISSADGREEILRINSELKKYVRELYSCLKEISDVNERKMFGKNINDFKNKVEFEINKALKNCVQTSSDSYYDPYIFKPSIRFGNVHPLIKLYKKMEKVLVNFGFSVVQGPEIELDRYNFEKLNMPHYHPARDMQDTFYVISPKVLLRSHTSSVQIRTMEKLQPPMSIISPGTVYRVDDIDAQHTPMFYQVEGLTVGEKISFANLKFVLITLLKEVFGNSTDVRFRPTYYPYTEPSAAIDMSCPKCNKKGCASCSRTGWITVLGSGMVHPKVFEDSGIDSEKYTGFAFGLGLNRLAMIYFGMSEIKKFYENDVSIWNQL